MNENILAIFTSEDRQELKDAFKKLIIEQLESDLKENYNYLFDPDDMQELCTQAIEEIKGEVKELLKNKMMKEMMAKLDL